ncbi:MAG: MliC family protein [Notoacmeibacter sp.]|nr:MliC family protein [Notoacmeibacter sp.]MCC0033398.1 MliC family protein [Brucellaceae bacterium]
MRIRLASAFLAAAIALPALSPAAKATDFGVAVPPMALFAVSVSAVYHSGGGFYFLGNGQWQERGDNGATFNFIETARGETTVMLEDRSRGVFIELNLAGNMIRYAGPGDNQYRDLYRIIGTLDGNQPVPQVPAPSAPRFTVDTSVPMSFYNKVNYTCSEGIPLTVEYVSRGGIDYVAYSMDGAAKVRLPQQQSGSGLRYSDGEVTILSKGAQVLIAFGGQEDRFDTCNER